jgi:hypothetical protein
LKRPPRPPPARVNWFKTIRVTILLLILAVVATSTWLDQYRATRWRDPLFVAIYPIAADDSPVTRRYLDALGSEQFAAIDRFFSREAVRYRLPTDRPVTTRLQPELTTLPPRRAPGAGIFRTMLWSLKLRYWAWNVSRHARAPADVRMFVLYHDPALTPTVPHSLGLMKGLIGVVYAFAAREMDGANDVVIAHELLHTVGATDKYEPGNDAPRFPDGFGDPNQSPLYPQRSAELMAGRRRVSATRWVQPDDLDQVVIGPATAREINWPARPRP